MEKRLIKIWNHQELEGFYQSHSNKSDMVKYQTHIEISTKLIFPIAEKFLSFLRSITQLYSNTARQHCGTDTHSASGDKFKVSFNLLLTHYIVSFEWRKFVVNQFVLTHPSNNNIWYSGDQWSSSLSGLFLRLFSSLWESSVDHFLMLFLDQSLFFDG